jgi:hypothetical protein
MPALLRPKVKGVIVTSVVPDSKNTVALPAAEPALSTVRSKYMPNGVSPGSSPLAIPAPHHSPAKSLWLKVWDTAVDDQDTIITNTSITVLI